ncbi:MAG: hypothetical protein ABSC06_12460 [Rhodopila sp.]|jgi:hypothetical protein
MVGSPVCAGEKIGGAFRHIALLQRGDIFGGVRSRQSRAPAAPGAVSAFCPFHSQEQDQRERP